MFLIRSIMHRNYKHRKHTSMENRTGQPTHVSRSSCENISRWYATCNVIMLPRHITASAVLKPKTIATNHVMIVGFVPSLALAPCIAVLKSRNNGKKCCHMKAYRWEVMYTNQFVREIAQPKLVRKLKVVIHRRWMTWVCNLFWCNSNMIVKRIHTSYIN